MNNLIIINNLKVRKKMSLLQTKKYFSIISFYEVLHVQTQVSYLKLLKPDFIIIFLICVDLVEYLLIFKNDNKDKLYFFNAYTILRICLHNFLPRAFFAPLFFGR